MVFERNDPEHHERTLKDDSTPSAGIDGFDEGQFAAIPLYDSLYVLAPLLSGQSRDDLLQESNRLAASDRSTLDPFDLPERDRMYDLAVQFVENHVRQVRGHLFRHPRHRVFDAGVLVISEKPMPRFLVRTVRLNWQVDHGQVTDVRGHRIAAFHLTRLRLPPRRFLWAVGHGDAFDLAYLLGNLGAMLAVHTPESVAATGIVALQTNQILGHGRFEDKREAALHGGMDHLILPFESHLMPGEHLGVRYWPVRDVNEAVFSFLCTASADKLIPDLKRRWRVKMAYSWASLIACLAGDGAYSLLASAGGFRENPAVGRWVALIGLLLFVVSIYSTHRYHRIDR